MKTKIIIFILIKSLDSYSCKTEILFNYFDSTINELKKSHMLKGEEKLIYSQKIANFFWLYIKDPNEANMEKSIDLLNLLRYENRYAFSDLSGRIKAAISKKKTEFFYYYAAITSCCCYKDTSYYDIFNQYHIDSNKLTIHYINYISTLVNTYKKYFNLPKIDGVSQNIRYLNILRTYFPKKQLLDKYSIG